jgi:hypothetical protein|tara:strand:+ start:9078 stop:9365 length:288 start_codon:yes stop_codon:yes gene_type:complete
MVLEGFKLVQKEEVADYHFPADEVLKKESEIANRNKSLSRAIALGNLEHQKVRIYFADEEGEKYVETTIWGLTDHEILLKKNVMLPIHRIIKLEI